MNIAYWLYQTARSWPNREAILSGNECFATYNALLTRTASLAHWLQHHHGVNRGDRVALFAQNCPEYLEIMHAIWWLGAVIVPINHKLHAKEAAWIIADSDAKIILTDADCSFDDAPCLQTVITIADATYNQAVSTAHKNKPADCDSNEIAWLFYTSGTTGRPKGVMLSHNNLIHMSLCYSLDVDQVFGSDTALYAAPMSHGAGLYNMIFIRAGARHLIPDSKGFDSAEIIDLAKIQKNLVFFAAPTMVKRLIAYSKTVNYQGEGIRTIIYGGGPMYAADIDEALDYFGDRFVQIYGQGESPMTITALSRDLVKDQSHANWRSRRASVGTAQACVKVEIRDDNGKPLPHGSTGEIAVFGQTVMQGYWNNPDATASTLNNGWLMTGDLGHLDEDGFLYLTDRSKDVIISGGTNIYPREVEETLLQHPDVFEVAVIGVPDPEWGENIVAYIVMRDEKPAEKTLLDQWCQSQMASFKKPKKYFFVKELPKNSYGKVLKTELRQLSLENN
ncbi:class I adenylate-forming enzyme family protein [Paenochrobactrum glaciei]|uniref:Long-chain fatty acid--CoA ligase n=1 Tax=Paenochrobactrum glaciei TaxID=486407 RepID=A0ABN1G9U8_9HYPH